MPDLTRGQRLARLLRLQGLYAFFATMHWCLAYRFLVVEQDFSLEMALVVSVVLYGTGALVLPLLRSFELRRAIRLGFLLRILTILPYAFWPTLPGVILASVFFGMALVYFWLPYNLMFFEHRERTNKAGISALYGSVVPFVDVVGALLAGFLVVRYGWTVMFVAAIAFGILPLLYSLRLTPREPTPVDLRNRLRRLPGLKMLIMIDGAVQGIIWPAVPLLTIAFIDGTFAYAGFFAALGLTGAGSALLLGRFSDRRARRLVFVVPFALAHGIANILSAFATGVAQWGAWRGVATLSATLFDPFKNTVFLDKADDVFDLYIGREFLLNVGRVVGVAALVAFTHFGQMQWALIAAGGLGLLFPVIIETKALYPDERYWPKPFRMTWRQ